MVDTGLRPEEAYRLQWQDVYWDRGRRGEFLTRFGKSVAAHRILSLTKRTRELLETRYSAAGKPAKGWIFPAETDSGHINESSLKRQHRTAFRTIRKQTPKDPVEPFVLYCLRHTFLTRLASAPLPDGSKIDVWTFMRLAGHASISMSLRYVHPEQSMVTAAMESLAEKSEAEHSEVGHKMATIQTDRKTIAPN